MPQEICAGCDRPAATGAHHLMVGVTRNAEGQMKAFPVCEECWKDPAHRKRNLKMHFFDRRLADRAVKAADENILVEKGHGHGHG
jgi:hypothetical protein